MNNLLSRTIATDAPYQLLPFNFFRLNGAHKNILVTSETGEHLYLDEPQLDHLINKRLDSRTSLYRDLLARHFIFEPNVHDPLPEMAAQYRSRKSFLADGVALHIIVVTLRCNHTCQYCQVSRAPLGGSMHDMSIEDADHTIERIFESTSPTLTVEFQGGEALLAFERIEYIVEKISQRNVTEQRDIQFVISTTLHHLDDHMLNFASAHNIHFSTSLDGPEFLHNANRPTPTRDSYQRTLNGVKRVRDKMGNGSVTALTTLTRKSLDYPTEIVDEYVKQGFSSISLRPLSPYGFAERSAKRLSYTAADYSDFYRKALDHIIALNQQGHYLSEGLASLFLTNILTPFATGYVDLRSPAGAGVGVLVYNYDGKVYPSDESRMLVEMGDDQLCLGSVALPLSELLASPVIDSLLAAGVAESLPGCADCALLHFCGADPIDHYARQADPIGHRAFSHFCQRNTQLLSHLFEVLRDAPSTTQNTLMTWIGRH
ncbi:His-Xaa-Ser system radical SAM maturase HxsB [Carnimonas bestiolae]|uniref:His-Xaa-Ser system radical SAM maturase HxsB n=1 Tax=Carnimonas bestiolae TaxID=3402172 RepID=UPI003EDC3E77